MASEEAVGLEELLKQAHGLPPDKQRKVASILGSVVADAAGTPRPKPSCNVYCY